MTKPPSFLSGGFYDECPFRVELIIIKLNIGSIKRFFIIMRGNCIHKKQITRIIDFIFSIWTKSAILNLN